MTTLRELLTEGTARLEGISDTPRLDAEVLICHLTGRSKLDLVARPETVVSEDTCAELRELLERRRAREPVAYLTGIKEFFGLEFAVTSDVLVPRPDTETLVEEALSFLDSRDGSNSGDGLLRILDLGTGSGCIAISIAAALARDGRPCSIRATDRSAPALRIARTNAARYGLEDSITFSVGSWYDAVPAGEMFDLIVSNPPYVAEGDFVSPETAFEPKRALYADHQGLADILYLLKETPARLFSDGAFLCEIGIDHAQMLRVMAQDGVVLSDFHTISFVNDLAGVERVLFATRL